LDQLTFRLRAARIACSSRSHTTPTNSPRVTIFTSPGNFWFVTTPSSLAPASGGRITSLSQVSAATIATPLSTISLSSARHGRKVLAIDIGQPGGECAGQAVPARALSARKPSRELEDQALCARSAGT
jgi:hypothetical protein